MTQIPEQHPLRQLFGRLTERNFSEALGWPDFQVTEYVSNLLLEFIHIDQLSRIKDHEGEPVETVVELLYAAESHNLQSSAEKERDIHRHIGDLTLFLAGLFPEYCKRIKCSGLIHHKDFLVDYVKAGKRSYSIVAAHQDPEGKNPPALFQTLSTNFELCVAGLGFVRLDLDRFQDPSLKQAKSHLFH
ncbi:MAG: hypothetical protein H6750_08130 [Nitrospiraceae bacterium]|nr:hypothetical protein [Nitrospira sp.]MCB9774281.1 hypothetical protein [Nitrospiraceae bacterium]